MGLRLKFNIAMLAVFLVGLALSAWVFYALLQQQARRQVGADDPDREPAQELQAEPGIGCAPGQRNGLGQRVIGSGRIR